MKIVINTCYGGFSLSDKAYEKLIEWGVPVKKHTEQKRDKKTLLYDNPPENEGEIIFDRTLNKGNSLNDSMMRLGGRYWETWLDRSNRNHPLLLKVVKELGEKANGNHAKLKIIKIPDDIEWEIEEYDGIEWIAEKHRTWE